MGDTQGKHMVASSIRTIYRSASNIRAQTQQQEAHGRAQRAWVCLIL